MKPELTTDLEGQEVKKGQLGGLLPYERVQGEGESGCRVGEPTHKPVVDLSFSSFPLVTYSSRRVSVVEGKRIETDVGTETPADLS